MQNTFSQSGNDSKWFLKKIIFQNRYVALETPSRPPPPVMANTILNFHFDYLNPSLKCCTKTQSYDCEGNTEKNCFDESPLARLDRVVGYNVNGNIYQGGHTITILKHHYKTKAFTTWLLKAGKSPPTAASLSAVVSLICPN